MTMFGIMTFSIDFGITLLKLSVSNHAKEFLTLGVSLGVSLKLVIDLSLSAFLCQYTFMNQVPLLLIISQDMTPIGS